VGEIHVFDWAKWATYYGAQLDELHMPFNFSLIGAKWRAAIVRGLIEAVEGAVPAGAWPNWVVGNHDEHRIATRIGPAQARTAMMMLLTLRGTPTVYYGDEIGMRDVPVPPEKVQDRWGKRVQGLGLGRDPQRTPMQWDTSPNAGFCPPQSEPWLPVADDYAAINVAAELDDPRSMLNLSRRLLELRRAEPALNSGRCTLVSNVPDDCVAYLRESGSQRYLILLNFSANPLRISLPDFGTAGIALSTNPDRLGEADLGAFDLAAHEGCILNLQAA
jgi:alpha-glucosidase